MEETNDKRWCVYAHTNKINNKKYIGITSRKPEIRWGYNGCKYKDQPYFYRAIQKYGWDNFTHEILFNDQSFESACRIEKDLIKHYKSNEREYGYNLTLGGDGRCMTEEQKRILSDDRKGVGNPFYGKSHSEETKNKMSEARKGEKSPNAKLTEIDVIGILRMLCEYASPTEIRNKYNISETALNKIKNKKAWSYLYDKFPELYDFPDLPQRHPKSISNTSGVVGVHLNKKRNKWVASLRFNGEYIFLGHFDNKIDAIKARLVAEVEYYGELAPQRHLFKQYEINILEDVNEFSQ